MRKALPESDEPRELEQLVAPAQSSYQRGCKELIMQRRAVGNQTGGRVGFFLSTDDFWRDYTAMTAIGIELSAARR